MSQQTLSEIHAAEAAKREVAARYETLLGNKKSLEQVVERLTKNLPGFRDALKVLQRIAADAAMLPEWVVSTGRGQRVNTGATIGPPLPGGYMLSVIFVDQATMALPQAQKRVDDGEALLSQAQKRLREVEAELKKF